MFGYRVLMLVVWLNSNIVGHINKVAVRRARLVLRWVTIRGYTIEAYVGWGGKLNSHLMASCVGNTCAKNPLKSVNPFQS